MIKCLFIGGSHDGERLLVKGEPPVVYLPERTRTRLTRIEILEATESVPMPPTEAYNRMTIQAENALFTLYVESSVSYERAMYLLIAGYRI